MWHHVADSFHAALSVRHTHDLLYVNSALQCILTLYEPNDYFDAY